MGGKGDIAAMFIASYKKYGIHPGFYHGAMNNTFLNVIKGTVQPGVSGPGGADITQDQYTKILLANLRQLCMLMCLRHASPPGFIPARVARSARRHVSVSSVGTAKCHGSPAKRPFTSPTHRGSRLIRVWFSAVTLAPCPHLAMYDSCLDPSQGPTTDR